MPRKKTFLNFRAWLEIVAFGLMFGGPAVAAVVGQEDALYKACNYSYSHVNDSTVTLVDDEVASRPVLHFGVIDFANTGWRDAWVTMVHDLARVAREHEEHESAWHERHTGFGNVAEPAHRDRPNKVPEPGTLALASLGLLAIPGVRRRILRR